MVKIRESIPSCDGRTAGHLVREKGKRPLFIKPFHPDRNLTHTRLPGCVSFDMPVIQRLMADVPDVVLVLELEEGERWSILLEEAWDAGVVEDTGLSDVQFMIHNTFFEKETP